MWLPAFETLIRSIPEIGDNLADVTSAWLGGDRRPVPGRRFEVHDPTAGDVYELASLGRYFGEAARIVRERNGTSVEIARFAGNGRVVGEYLATLAIDGKTVTLPVAVVIDPLREPIAIRIYHSLYPLFGEHRVRPEILRRDQKARASGVVGEYFDALERGDVNGILATYEPDGSFREPSGGEFEYRGTEALRTLYTRFFSAGGGIGLDHCAVSEDRVRTAMEYSCVRWGIHDLPPQAGMAVYARGPGGKIASAHVYDDVTPPV